MKIIKSVTVTDDVTLVVLSKTPTDIVFVAKVFEALSDADVNVDMISQSPVAGNTSSLSFTIAGESLTPTLMVVSSLREQYPDITPIISSDNCKIAVNGDEMRVRPGVASAVFKAAASVGADIRLITTSEVDISLLVTKADEPAALSAIKSEFAEN